MGTLIHSAVLEPRRFLDNFMIAPDVDRRTKEGKAQWEEFHMALAVKEGSIGLKQAEADVVVGVAKAMLSHPLASNLLKGGVAEHSFYFEDPVTGLQCKIRPDTFVSDQGILVDVKTALDASYTEFRKQIDNLEYFVQAAFQLFGMKQVYGAGAIKFYAWLAVEKEPPYAIAIYRADEALIDLGEEMFRNGLNLIKRCTDANNWPGYQYDEDEGRFKIQDIGLTPWRFTAQGVL